MFRVNLYRKPIADQIEDSSGVIRQNSGHASAENQKTDQEVYETDQETSQESYETNQETSQETNEMKIRDAIANNPSVTQKELQDLTGLSRSGVRYILQQMREAGELERIGSTKKGHWLLRK